MTNGDMGGGKAGEPGRGATSESAAECGGDFVPQWIIEKKRDGGVLADAEIRQWIKRYSDGSLPDYQMAALAMAVFFRGMTPEETLSLTDAMMRSGDCLSWDDLDRPTADKHSTGGIGDKISLPLAPLVAACGVAVPMISGRGLGVTGGTLDKLESIPGYDATLPVGRFREIVRDVGCSIVGQTARLAPADRKLYALRDVTGTVPSIPLITASILSKKLAEGAGTLVFDVKCGSGAFMKTRKDADALAHSLVSVARGAGRAASALVTPMDSPLGAAVGNALEVAESVRLLSSDAPPEGSEDDPDGALASERELVFSLGSEMLRLSGAADDEATARAAMETALSSGAALETFARMVAAHGGEARVAEDPLRVLPSAPAVIDFPSPQTGTVAGADADLIGRAALLLGAGRRATSDAVDAAVGLDRIRARGARVAAGEPLARVHARSPEAAREVFPLLREAFRFES